MTTDALKGLAAIEDALPALANAIAQAAATDRVKADHRAVCEQIAAMHAAAVGEVRAPLLGYVEDVASVHHAFEAQRARADTLNRLCGEQRKRADQAERRAFEAEQALRTLRGVTDTERADQAEAERDELHAALGLAPGQLNSAALSAIRGRGTNVRELTTRAETAEATIERMKRTNRMVNGGARQERERAEKAEKRLDEHRRNLAAILAKSGDTPLDELTEYAARTLTRNGERLLAAEQLRAALADLARQEQQ